MYGRGVCMAGGMHVWQGCVHGMGHAWQGGVRGKGGGMRGRRDGHCSGRYAYYWNTFLFHCILTALFSLRVEQNKCAETICQHDGTCTEDYENQTYHCACVTGYEGVDCHKRKSRVPPLNLEDFLEGGRGRYRRSSGDVCPSNSNV